MVLLLFILLLLNPKLLNFNYYICKDSDMDITVFIYYKKMKDCIVYSRGSSITAFTEQKKPQTSYFYQTFLYKYRTEVLSKIIKYV